MKMAYYFLNPQSFEPPIAGSTFLLCDKMQQKYTLDFLKSCLFEPVSVPLGGLKSIDSTVDFYSIENYSIMKCNFSINKCFYIQPKICLYVVTT